jgi:hypothetical protein
VVELLTKQRALGEGELRLLNRLSLNPSLRQSAIAKELGISRCALNQSWRRLEHLYHLRIRSDIDYGHYGFHLLFGWASSNLGSRILHKFHRWLLTNSYVIAIIESEVSSNMKKIIYFEAALPLGSDYLWFTSQLERFRKRPYNLEVVSSDTEKISNQLNPGQFNGSEWEFEDGFQFEASIGAVSHFIEVIPSPKTLRYTKPVNIASPQNLVVASVLEKNYHATATFVSKKLKKVGIRSPSTRTIRRYLVKIRQSHSMPYLDISNIGLAQLMFVCFEEHTQERRLTKLLETQAGSFPRNRIISGNELTVLQFRIPQEVDWLKLSQMLSQQVGATTGIFTFIASNPLKQSGIDGVISKVLEKSKEKS